MDQWIYDEAKVLCVFVNVLQAAYSFLCSDEI